MSIISVVAGFLIVFFFRLLSVTLGTARQILVVRGYKYPGAFLGFFEVLIFTLAISKVIRDGAIGDILGYSLGFSVGTIIGATIEEKLALGYLNVRIITHDKAKELVDSLRDHGFGVTEVVGEGRDGLVYVLEVVVRRKDLRRLHRYVREIHDRAFIVVGDAQSVQRGYFISESTR
jgi:uncharacterized protein YebE (UPF0316 family)